MFKDLRLKGFSLAWEHSIFPLGFGALGGNFQALIKYLQLAVFFSETRQLLRMSQDSIPGVQLTPSLL